ncbi:MAG: radical SAM protein [Selenomonadaceae bacterium]|nr:radical SAM protein [Selenomonadaceae bacterium]
MKGKRKNKNKSQITVLYADENGEIFDAPGLAAMGRQGEENIPLQKEDLIPLPEGADLMFLPERQPLGLAATGEIMPVSGQAVAAILPMGYTRTRLPAYAKEETAKPLPLFGYTAVALYQDELYAAALSTDANTKWNPLHYNTHELKRLIRRTQKDIPHNPIVEQLAKCSLEWHCLTAENLFYRRWEAGLPTSPQCNAKCFGCISRQESECCPSPQNRITFRPTAEEIAAVGIYHLKTAPEGIISFGQGCEGEPALAADNVAPAIKLMREATTKGQINMNSNAGYTEGIKKIVDAGLDSLRVSIISANEENYQAYYRANYTLADVKSSIDYALKNKVRVSLNLLYLPGFNDREEELMAWEAFLQETPIEMIQMRNLNVDPDEFLSIMPKAKGKIWGTRVFIERLKQKFPRLTIGSFSHYYGRRDFNA